MRLYLFSGGVLFAVLQYSYYLLLEWHLSSSWVTYAAVSSAWLAGILAGLGLPRGRAPWPLALGVAAYYLMWGVVRSRPFQDELLPVYALCVAFSGGAAGWFFRACYARLGDARGLLLHENNGFVAGWLASFLGYSLYGYPYLLCAPAACGLLVWAAGRSGGWSARSHSAEEI